MKLKTLKHSLNTMPNPTKLGMMIDEVVKELRK